MLTCVVPSANDGAEVREATTYWKVFANALFLVSLNIGNS